MNIAVISLKDVAKNLVKIIIIVFLIIILTSFFKTENIKKQEEVIKESINSKTRQISNYAFTGCLDLSLSLISYSKKDEDKEKLLGVGTILNLELGMLDKGVLKAMDIIINEEE